MYEYGETEHAAWRSASPSYKRVHLLSRRPRYPDGDNSKNFGAKQTKLELGIGGVASGDRPLFLARGISRAPLRTSNEDDEAASDGDGIP